MSALLPVAWVKSGRIEKKVISEHKKLAGTSDIDAKVLYVKLARGLPTFGVHFFLVKVRETVCDEAPLRLRIYTALLPDFSPPPTRRHVTL